MHTAQEAAKPRPDSLFPDPAAGADLVAGARSHADEVFAELDRQRSEPSAAGLARTTDPDTSHQAAESAVRIRQEDSRLIVDVMRRAGRPLAAHEIATLSCDRLDKVQVNRRLAELRRAGVVRRTQERVRCGPRTKSFRHELTGRAV